MQKVKKAYEITDAKISFVSLVDKPANKRPFLLTKAEDGQASFTTYGRIIKTDTENHYVTGIVYEPMEEDSHGNYMTAEEITRTAYWFAKNGDKVDLQHSFVSLENASVVETWVAKADFKIGDEVIKEGTWLMTVEVSDESVWEAIQKGEITGFSMGGLGNYSEEDIDLNSVSKQETSEKKGLLTQLAKALGLKVEKGAMAGLYEERNKGTLFWNAFNSLEDLLYGYNRCSDKYEFEEDESIIREALEDFSNIIQSILTTEKSITKAIAADNSVKLPIKKAGKKISNKNKSTLEGIYESLGNFLKEFDEDKDEETDDDNQKEEKEVTKQEVGTIVTKSVEAAIAKALDEKKNLNEENENNKNVKKSDENITQEQVQDMIAEAVEKAIEPVLQSKNLPSNLNGSSQVKKSSEHYLHGIL